ncbi:MAG: hypothetical protein ACRDFB_03740 [Rhabdochlamydiaceae bacterium]
MSMIVTNKRYKKQWAKYLSKRNTGDDSWKKSRRPPQRQRTAGESSRL